MTTPFAAEIALPPLVPPFVAVGGYIQIAGADNRVTLALRDPDGQQVIAQWTPAEARAFADRVASSIVLAINGADGRFAQVQLPGDLPSTVADYLRAAADRAE